MTTTTETTATIDEHEVAASPAAADAHEAAALDAEDGLADDEPYTKGIVKNHVIAAMGLGLIPVPMFDVAAIVAVQLSMVNRLGDAYGVPFKKNAVRGSILALIGGIAPVALGMSATSFLKLVPGFGSVAGAAGTVVLAGALTYAVGSVFDRHLAKGGTFTNFSASSAREAFKQKFDEGKRYASDLKSKAKKPEAQTAAEAPATDEPAAADPASPPYGTTTSPA